MTSHLFPLLMSQHGEAVQYAAGAETKICWFLWGEGEEGESSQPHDEDDGSGGRILIKTEILTVISQFIFLIFTIMMWPEDKLDMELTQHLSMLLIKGKDPLILSVRHFTFSSLKNSFTPLHTVDELFFFSFLFALLKKSSLLYCFARCVEIFCSNKST